MSTAGPRVVSRALDAALVCFAVAGLVSVAWWVASAALGLGLVTFLTGSMSPGFPTGSVAVSGPVALQEVRVGDVVTVQRPGGVPPITHRVVSIDVAPSGARAVVRLKGDANRVEDPTAYDVTSLRRVLLPLPPIADALRYTASPFVVAGIGSVIVGSLAFAFWPERIRPRHREDGPTVRSAASPVGRRTAS